jgi:hypothetical protein
MLDHLHSLSCCGAFCGEDLHARVEEVTSRTTTGKQKTSFWSLFTWFVIGSMAYGRYIPHASRFSPRRTALPCLFASQKHRYPPPVLISIKTTAWGMLPCRSMNPEPCCVALRLLLGFWGLLRSSSPDSSPLWSCMRVHLDSGGVEESSRYTAIILFQASCHGRLSQTLCI